MNKRMFLFLLFDRRKSQSYTRKFARCVMVSRAVQIRERGKNSAVNCLQVTSPLKCVAETRKKFSKRERKKLIRRRRRRKSNALDSKKDGRRRNFIDCSASMQTHSNSRSMYFLPIKVDEFCFSCREVGITQKKIPYLFQIHGQM